jgi:hypothetical protein
MLIGPDADTPARQPDGPLVLAPATAAIYKDAPCVPVREQVAVASPGWLGAGRWQVAARLEVCW